MAPSRCTATETIQRIPRRCGDGPEDRHDYNGCDLDSPQVRGWPVASLFTLTENDGFPAGAGMAPKPAAPPRLPLGIPRRCGDGPGPTHPLETMATDSPQVRGWPRRRDSPARPCAGFPAGAGMAPTETPAAPTSGWIPRRCGDGPMRGTSVSSLVGDSPQVRGWPRQRHRRQPGNGGFPAGAGMARGYHGMTSAPLWIPRRCGDGPILASIPTRFTADSPQVRGWPEAVPAA